MANLGSALGSATRSLAAFSEALAVIQNNIANAATPGYARQRVSLAPIVSPRGRSMGVEVGRVQSLRDRLLDFQVLLSRQSASLFEKKAEVYQQIEPVFNLTGEASLTAGIDRFFGALSALSISPGDFNLRREVLDAAGRLVDVTRSTYSRVSGRMASLDGEARAVVTQVNGLLEQAAGLASLGTNSAGNQNFAAQTRLSQVLDELAGLINFTLIHQSDGTLSIVAAGEALVVGTTVRPLRVGLSNEGISIFDENGRDVTAGFENEGGQLGAILELRNGSLPGYLDQINRLAKSVADQVNEQHARGVDITGASGAAIFEYQTSFVDGTGRTAGTTGATTPAPPVDVTVTFSGGLSGSITAVLDSFFAASSAPTSPAAGDTVSVSFTSADGTIERTITTAPLLGSESTAQLATRLNDQIAVDPELAGLVTFSDAGGNLKVVLSDQAGQGFSFTATTSNPAFTTGLEGGGTLGGHSAEEIAAALNQQVAGDPALADAGVRFTAINGEIRFDAYTAFDYTIVDNDAAGTGFASGLAGSGSAGGGSAAATLRLAGLGPANVAAGFPGSPAGNENALALAALADVGIVDGVTYTEAYAALVSEVGQDSAGASSQLQTQTEILQTAQGLRDSFSGVDLNEEAVRLLEFQQAFQAQIRVIQVIDSLATEILSLVR